MMDALIDWLDLKGAQLRAVTVRGRDVVVTAGAGCGKTHTLVARYMSLLEDGLQPRQIVAVTFTEKAAREMRNRVRSEIARWRSDGCLEAQRERWAQCEADIDTARIGTIHSLCLALLRSHPVEAGVDPLPSVLDDGRAAALRTEAVEDALAWAIGQDDLSGLFARFEVEQLRELIGLLLAARLDAKPLLASAPLAGHRAVVANVRRFLADDDALAGIAELNHLRDSGRLIADAGATLAPSVHALLEAWSAAERDLAAGDLLGAIHALQDMRAHCVLHVGPKSCRAKDAIRTLRARYAAMAGWLGGDPPNEESERVAAEAYTGVARLFDRACDIYQVAKDVRQALDFDDLEAKAAALLADPAVRRFWQRQVAALLVDEFQDTNERQRNIVEALAGVRDGLLGRLFVVGDAKQSIYRFRGADVAVFRRLDRAVRERGGEPVTLDLTFRAHEPLVSLLNELLSTVMGVEDDPDAPHSVPFAPLSAHRTTPRPAVCAPYVEMLIGLGDDAGRARSAAAATLARRLWQLHDREGIRWEEIALLFRAASGFPPCEAALEAAGIPFVTVAGSGFYDRPEIRDVLNILCALADPTDDLAMAGLLRSPAFGLSDVALYQLRWSSGDLSSPAGLRSALAGIDHLSEPDRRQAAFARESIDHLLGLVDRVPVAELIKLLLDRTQYHAILASASPGLRLQRNLDKLLADAHASQIVRVGEFLDYVQTLRGVGAREGEAPAEAGGAVRLMTVHKAKGLQFPVVVLADAAHGRPAGHPVAILTEECGLALLPRRLEYVPLSYRLAKALNAERDQAEDCRLLYVAATRAQEKLLISGHRSKADRGSWLKSLLAAAGIAPEALDQSDGDAISVTLPVCGHELAATAVRSLEGPEPREPGLHTVAEPPESIAGAPSSARVRPTGEPLPSRVVAPSREPIVGAHGSAPLRPIYQPLPLPTVADSHQSVSAASRYPERSSKTGDEVAPPDQAEPSVFRIPRITGRRVSDGKILGTLVHAAIRRWCFAGDPALDRLLRSAAYACGLVEPADVSRHAQDATALLARLRADARWPELDAAERHHEVPFILLRAGVPSPGIIDLLYRTPGAPVWHIVDFKTERVASEGELLEAVAYHRPQLQRYEHAVVNLLGGQVTSSLCFLDCDGSVRWLPLSRAT